MDNGIYITAYCPLARREIFSDSVITSIAKKHNASSAQICLKWLIKKKIIAIPKATSLEHLKENLGIFSIKLSKEDIQKIDSIKQWKRLVNPGFVEFFD